MQLLYLHRLDAQWHEAAKSTFNPIGCESRRGSAWRRSEYQSSKSGRTGARCRQVRKGRNRNREPSVSHWRKTEERAGCFAVTIVGKAHDQRVLRGGVTSTPRDVDWETPVDLGDLIAVRPNRRRCRVDTGLECSHVLPAIAGNRVESGGKVSRLRWTQA